MADHFGGHPWVGSLEETVGATGTASGGTGRGSVSFGVSSGPDHRNDQDRPGDTFLGRVLAPYQMTRGIIAQFQKEIEYHLAKDDRARICDALLRGQVLLAEDDKQVAATRWLILELREGEGSPVLRVYRRGVMYAAMLEWLQKFAALHGCSYVEQIQPPTVWRVE